MGFGTATITNMIVKLLFHYVFPGYLKPDDPLRLPITQPNTVAAVPQSGWVGGMSHLLAGSPRGRSRMPTLDRGVAEGALDWGQKGPPDWGAEGDLGMRHVITAQPSPSLPQPPP